MQYALHVNNMKPAYSVGIPKSRMNEYNTCIWDPARTLLVTVPGVVIKPRSIFSVSDYSRTNLTHIFLIPNNSSHSSQSLHL